MPGKEGVISQIQGYRLGPDGNDFWILFEVHFPRRFSVTVREDWIDYELCSAEYAAEFTAQNETPGIKI